LACWTKNTNDGPQTNQFNIFFFSWKLTSPGIIYPTTGGASVYLSPSYTGGVSTSYSQAEDYSPRRIRKKSANLLVPASEVQSQIDKMIPVFLQYVANPLLSTNVAALNRALSQVR